MAVSEQTFQDLREATLAEIDPDVVELIGRELERQRGQIELIASENFTWPSVFEGQASVPTNKYAEGYPGRRYYGGCEVVDEIEQLAIDRVKALFGAEHANVQPHAGAQTNMAVYFSLPRARGHDPRDAARPRRPPDARAQGQLLRAGSTTSPPTASSASRASSTSTRSAAWPQERRPKLIVCGASAYPRTIEAERFREIADEVGALLLCDMAHIAGPRRRRAPSEPDAALRLRHLDGAQDARRPALRVRALPGGARDRARQGRLPRDAGRAAHAHDRGQGDLLQDRRVRGLPRLPAPGARQRRRARRDARRAAASTSSRAARTRTSSRSTCAGASGRARTPRTASPRCNITANRNTVPFDERPPTVASGIRLGTPAVDDARVRRGRLRRGRLRSSSTRSARRRPRGARAREARRSASRHPLYPGFRGYVSFAS